MEESRWVSKYVFLGRLTTDDKTEVYMELCLPRVGYPPGAVRHGSI